MKKPCDKLLAFIETNFFSPAGSETAVRLQNLVQQSNCGSGSEAQTKNVLFLVLFGRNFPIVFLSFFRSFWVFWSFCCFTSFTFWGRHEQDWYKLDQTEIWQNSILYRKFFSKLKVQFIIFSFFSELQIGLCVLCLLLGMHVACLNFCLNNTIFTNRNKWND